MESVKNRDQEKTAKALLAMRRPRNELPVPRPLRTLLARTAPTRPPYAAKRRGVDEYGEASTTTSESHGEDDDLDLPPHRSRELPQSTQPQGGVTEEDLGRPLP
jgi:hypothetical protein